MNISPVSFSSTAAATAPLSFEDRIKQPQAYLTQEAPAASSKIKADGEKKKSPAKTIAGLIVGIGAIAAGLAVGAKKGLFAPGKNATLNTVKGYLEKAGNTIAKNAAKVKNLVASKLPKAAQTAEQAAETVVEATV